MPVKAVVTSYPALADAAVLSRASLRAADRRLELITCLRRGGDRHLSTADFREEVLASGAKISLTTVYNTLTALAMAVHVEPGLTFFGHVHRKPRSLPLFRTGPTERAKQSFIALTRRLRSPRTSAEHGPSDKAPAPNQTGAIASLRQAPPVGDAATPVSPQENK